METPSNSNKRFSKELYYKLIWWKKICVRVNFSFFHNTVITDDTCMTYLHCMYVHIMYQRKGFVFTKKKILKEQWKIKILYVIEFCFFLFFIFLVSSWIPFLSPRVSDADGIFDVGPCDNIIMQINKKMYTYIIDVLVFTRTKQLWNDTIEIH